MLWKVLGNCRCSWLCVWQPLRGCSPVRSFLWTPGAGRAVPLADPRLLPVQPLWLLSLAGAVLVTSPCDRPWLRSQPSPWSGAGRAGLLGEAGGRKPIFLETGGEHGDLAPSLAKPCPYIAPGGCLSRIPCLLKQCEPKAVAGIEQHVPSQAAAGR